MASPKRLTQHDIAKLAGVSQATVSLVLNGAPTALARIPLETRERVQQVIRTTGYVADPIARRMAKGLNRILGVFTYEPAFPSEQADFFTPFLLGIEEEAQAQNYDLLLLTGAGVGNDRKIFADGNRLRIADGCLVLGREFDRAELKRLVSGDYPFVAIGRREDAGGPVPYVGGDYATGTRALVEKARALGHEKLAYVGPNGSAESVVDRWHGFAAAVAEGAELVLHVDDVGRSAGEILDTILTCGATAVFFVELADAVRVEAVARERGLSVPDDFSAVVLGRHVRAGRSHVQFTSFNIPREEMGRQATAMLVRRIEGAIPIEQVLLTCEPVEGETLGPAKKRN
ncbi:LacI family DNA-binding transcriptional regulator [Rhizobium sp. NZLR1b]|uniref:LacI family DNA-binding transcriptional regulator n=1 Tax=unclassified Rhizobium TaxID=2613769 RepID=UPI001C83E4DB|nr:MULTISPECIES: LacI family DNA-binding transcriptional regulator [unclassified Rhizobium]MBX5159222.1 LacI family DNA-binding transcriptional regulator [Rhizobium sp. NZLR8]MBX5170914.1 LacI family DNA-binding transcriptional regulator [Rhizobium sp. NZLR1b]MBX5181366.1 LacI family DNA-binding transcriptional regulator [Rhizobium sp. NZLR5]MBX5188272.1 LacI family DNA-binding transcriptional regulator [Rhizobium sp. NZLR3b]MBX5199319.1 LacI family DNA-binding transcriptional regulator [Rhizo